MTPDDADLLLQWRNDPETRRQSLQTAFVQRDEHQEWLKQSLARKDRQMYIAEVEGVPVGTVRVDLVDECHMLSWTVAPGVRGRGVGEAMVKKLVQKISGRVGAEIKVGNTASRRIAEHVGMWLEKEKDGVLFYVRSSTQNT